MEKLLLREALDYGLLCSLTGFVAARQEHGKPVERTSLVGSALPDGWADDFAPPPPSRRAYFQMAASSPDLASGGALYEQPAHPRDISLGEYPDEDSGGGNSLPRRLTSSLRRKRNPSVGIRPRVAALASAVPQISVPEKLVLLSGPLPPFVGGEATLFDTDRAEDAAKLPNEASFSSLTVRYLNGSPKLEAIDPGLILLVFVGDMAAAVAWVRLVDLARQGGRHPLSFVREAGERVRVVLVDSSGVWTKGAPQLEAALA